MVSVDLLEIEGKCLIGIRVEFKGAPLLILLYKDLSICCGYINLEVMEKFGNAACIVRGVKTFEDVLNAEIREVTSKAMEMGAKPGIRVRDLLRVI